MTKTDFILKNDLKSAPDEIKEEIMDVLADMPEELSPEHVQEIANYMVLAQAREAELALGYGDAADILEKYADEVDQNFDDEDQQISATLRNTLETAQNLSATA